MLKRLYSMIFAVLFSFLFISNSNAQGWTDDFDTYVAGQQLACQNSVNWNVWSGVPCTVGEDALISTVHALTAPNSFVVAQNNDLVAMLNTTTGTWYVGFYFYIETGRSGYFNMLSDFTFVTGGYWAFECYFDVGGGGRLIANHVTTNFTYNYDTWNFVVVMANLGADQASFTMNGSTVLSWPWTQGSSTGAGPLAIDVADFYGATAFDQMYVDHFYFGNTPPPPIPVELASFTASVTPQGHAVLNWSTASEINNRGFEIERRSVDGQFATVGFVEGYGTTTEEQTYTYVDRSVNPGTYYYRLKQIDLDGQFEYFGEIELDVTPPLAFGIEQNYPNPFNPNTSIKYSVAEAGYVRLAVYNTLGEEISVLVNGQSDAGFFEVNFDASNLPSGTYIYRLEAPGFAEAKKMILMK
jgi:hypothetical protein